jgi:hypothetical protein
MTWRGPWDGPWDGAWEGGDGEINPNAMAANLGGSGAIAATLTDGAQGAEERRGGPALGGKARRRSLPLWRVVAALREDDERKAREAAELARRLEAKRAAIAAKREADAQELAEAEVATRTAEVISLKAERDLRKLQAQVAAAELAAAQAAAELERAEAEWRAFVNRQNILILLAA